MTHDITRRAALKTIGLGIGGLTVGSGMASADPGLGTVVSYDPAAGELPENVAIDPRGDKYVSLAPLGELRRISPDNETETVHATLDVNAGDNGLLGLEVTPKGIVYACLVTTPGADPLGVWRIAPDGSTSLYAGLPRTSFPNDVLLDGDRLLVTDTTLGAVWEVREGDATPWVVDPLLAGTGAIGFGIPLGANGIARTKDGTVYVANTEKGHVVRIPVRPDGSAGTPEVFVDGLVVLDGMAVDTRDALYATSIGGNLLYRVESDGTVDVLATGGDGLDNPSDVTFGRARGEQKTVYVTNFALLSRANPGLVTLDVGVPGAPVHR